VEEYHRWFKGISKAVKEIHVVGRNPTETDKERIIITTGDAGKKPKAAIAALTITCGNGVHITRKGMSFDKFIQLAQTQKATASCPR